MEKPPNALPARSRGPRLMGDVPMKRVYVTLDDYTREFMHRLGMGNISAGIREAARIIYETRKASMSGRSNTPNG